MGALLRAYGRAFSSQWHGRVVLLSVAPFVLALGLWALLLYCWLQPLIDAIGQLFAHYDGYRYSNSVLNALGLGVARTIIVPLLAMLLLLPLMILTALLFIGAAAMPAVTRHIGRRRYPQLAQHHGGSLAGSAACALGAMLLFLLLWALTLPLYAFPPLALAVQTLLWGRMTARVMVYDALADYASADERRLLQARHRWPLLAIGVLSGLAGALPGALWLGGTALSVLLFPFLAAASIWLYVVIFLFTGMWFAYYCLEALAQLRAEQPVTDH